MLSENLVKAFNAQINAEMWSSNLYLSMSVYFAQNGYDGMASWMRAQSKEELNHAYEMIDFVIKRNGNVEIRSDQRGSDGMGFCFGSIRACLSTRVSCF